MVAAWPTCSGSNRPTGGQPPAGAGFDCLAQADQGRRVGAVDGDGMNAEAFRRKRLRCGLELAGLHVRHEHDRLVAGELSRDRQAEPLRGARHDDDLILELALHGTPPLRTTLKRRKPASID